MRKVVCLFALLAMVAAVDAAPGLASPETVNRIVAVVGEDVITAQDLEQVQKVIEDQIKGRESEYSSQDLARLRRLALDRVIEQTLFDQQVKKLGIRVTNTEIEAFIKRIKQTNNMDDSKFLAHLSRRGMTPEEYRAELKKDILRRRLIARAVQKRVVITDKEIEEYYKAHSGSYSSLGGVMIRALFLRVPGDAEPVAAQAIRKQAEDLRKQVVDDGADLAELAKKFSQGPGADNGGKLGPIKADDLLPAMRLALAELKTNQVSPVLEIPSGFVFIKLLDSSGESSMPPDAMREEIRQKLEKEANEKAFQEWMKELRANTYIKIFD